MLFKNMIVEGIVNSISKRNFTLNLPDDFIGIVYINEISDYFINDISKIVCLNSNILVEIVKVDKNNRIALCSFKSTRPVLLRNPFEFELKETKEGFGNLLYKCQKEINKWKKSN